MKVPFADFGPQYHEIKNEVDQGLKAIFEQGNFILGQPVKDFEAAFATHCQAKHGIGVNSGTDAIHLAMRALGVGPGDEVIVPTFTFVATALGVSYTGTKPVFVDIEEDTHNMDPQAVEKAITKKTKAIMPVHLYGQPANMEAINKIAKKKDIAVVEDACQAHGAMYQNRRIGSLGTMACFSFYPTKSLGACGDGGMVVTSDDALAEKVRMFRDYGRTGRYEHKFIGYNSRLDTVQAVILLAKLKHLDRWNKMRADVSAHYHAMLKDVKGVILPSTRNDRTHVFQTFAVSIKKDRDKVCERMQKKEISVLIHYPIPIHLQEAYRDTGCKKGDFPVSEAFAGEELSLPMFPHMTKEQVESVVSALKESL